MPTNNNHSLVFIHGNSSSSKVFSKQVDYFEGSIADDLPGHGLSLPSKAPSKDYSVDAIRNTLIQRYSDIRSCVLAGNSLGGHLAIEIAPHMPNLKCLILFGTPPIKKPLNIEEAFLPTEALSSFFQGEFDESYLRKTLHVIAYEKEDLELLLQDFMKTDLPFRDVWAKSITDDQLLDEVEIVKSLKVPVYVIHGKQDPSVNIDYVRGLDGITKVYEIDKCGHYPSLEQPERFNEIVEEILEKI